jgi:hypothetical protein
MHPITEQALDREDDHWQDAEGYIIIWKHTVVGHSHNRDCFYIYGGDRDRGVGYGGHTSARYAKVFPTYQEAIRWVDVQSDYPPNSLNEVLRKNTRIVKVRIRRPVEVLEDLPADLLGALAEV